MKYFIYPNLLIDYIYLLIADIICKLCKYKSFLFAVNTILSIILLVTLKDPAPVLLIYITILQCSIHFIFMDINNIIK